MLASIAEITGLIIGVSKGKFAIMVDFSKEISPFFDDFFASGFKDRHAVIQ